MQVEGSRPWVPGTEVLLGKIWGARPLPQLEALSTCFPSSCPRHQLRPWTENHWLKVTPQGCKAGPAEGAGCSPASQALRKIK